MSARCKAIYGLHKLDMRNKANANIVRNAEKEKIMVKKIENNNMDEALKSKAAVVDFSATWCGPCKMLAPVLDGVAEEYAGKVDFFNADTDENTALAQQYGITNIPALIFLKDGKPVSQNVGFVPKDALKGWIDAQL